MSLWITLALVVAIAVAVSYRPESPASSTIHLPDFTGVFEEDEVYEEDEESTDG